MTRLSATRGSPSNGVPSGSATSQMSRAVAPDGRSRHGSTANVEGSGWKYMSDCSIRL